MAVLIPEIMVSNTRRLLQVLVWAAVAAALPARGAVAQNGVDPDTYTAVKAGMILTFARYATWPPAAFDGAGDPVIVAVVGRDPVESALRDIVRDEFVHGRPVRVRRVDPPRPSRLGEVPDGRAWAAFADRLAAAHVVFLAATEREHQGAIVEAVRDRPVMTISDIEDFAERGGMLGLAVRERHIAFDANPRAIERAGLEVSSKVLRLARIVESPGSGE